MKTHKDIYDAIRQVELLPSEDTNRQILEILDGLNDRILEYGLACKDRNSDAMLITGSLGSGLAALEARQSEFEKETRQMISKI